MFLVLTMTKPGIGSRLFVKTVTSSELVNSAAGVNQLLLSGVERMAGRANFYTDVLLCGARVNNVSASASDLRLLIIRMNFLFHCVSPLSVLI